MSTLKTLVTCCSRAKCLRAQGKALQQIAQTPSARDCCSRIRAGTRRSWTCISCAWQRKGTQSAYPRSLLLAELLVLPSGVAPDTPSLLCASSSATEPSSLHSVEMKAVSNRESSALCHMRLITAILWGKNYLTRVRY